MKSVAPLWREPHPSSAVLVPQHDRSACTGGQGIDPYEQNTQQSPALGFSTAAQPRQS